MARPKKDPAQATLIDVPVSKTALEAKETPLMKQYNTFKAQYPGAILLFRVGDFYETFGEDAIRASRILGITLTRRHNGAASDMELAGFPHHALDTYLPKLVRAGERVAICDQLEDPRFAKKLVKRGVTELVTPGVVYHDQVLEASRSNYLAAIHVPQTDLYGAAFLDISTGEFLTTEGNKTYIEKLLQSFAPAEILLSKTQRTAWQEWMGEQFTMYYLEEWFFQEHFGRDTLLRHFRTASLKGFGIDELPQGIAAAGAILHYLSENQQQDLRHIASIARVEEERYVWLDKFTIRNLELLHPQNPGGVALIDILDKTLTPMGARLLRKWTVMPLKDIGRIEERLSVVEVLYQNPDLGEEIATHLKIVGDVERLISKVAARRVRPRELVQLTRALGQIAALKQLLDTHEHYLLKKFGAQLHACEYIADKLRREMHPEPRPIITEGGLINDGVNEELDQLRHLVRNSKKYLDTVVQHATMETGISSLKVDYNKVFGYYLEVTNTHKHKVPKSWIRKQTLTNAERYITEELKVYEDKILHAEDKINALEQKLYHDLVQEVSDFTLPIQQNAKVLALLDCLLNFARLAQKYRYTKPTLCEDTTLRITAGRHPVIEQQLGIEEQYIPNDIYLDTQSQQIIVITGPNMAGKSALLRQTALIVLMAQMGCYVPAEAAEIGWVDKIFTRVGASDNLARGESTFMVEMMETASIMHNLSERSLVLMDEIGRGTSTYDGISIAWAILEYLHQHTRHTPRTLFATHYHELNELAKDFPRIKNYHVTVKEAGNRIIFLRKLAEGGSEHSFGIHVAQMAGMPREIVLRAQAVMQSLEADREKPTLPSPVGLEPLMAATPQDAAMERLRAILHKIDVNTISPIEALLKLNELKNLL